MRWREVVVGGVEFTSLYSTSLYHMESRGLSRKDLEPYIGSRARVSEILNKRRHLSIDMIRKLNNGLGIPAEVLIQPYNCERVA